MKRGRAILFNRIWRYEIKRERESNLRKREGLSSKTSSLVEKMMNSVISLFISIKQSFIFRHPLT